MLSRRANCRAQVLERSREELLYNKLLLLEHELRQYVHDISRKIRDLSDIDSIREIVRLVDVELARQDNVERYHKIITLETPVHEDRELLDNEYSRIDCESMLIEEYYVGKRMLEKLLISTW